MTGRAFVTGATGFVGSHLVERLSALGWEVAALTRPGSDTARLGRLGVERVPGDLDDPRALARGAAGARVVFHLAAVTAARDPGLYLRVNAEGTRRVAAAARESDETRRLVYLSSYAACGPAPGGRPRTADDPPAPLTAYGRSKLAGEESALAELGGSTSLLVIRAPVVYGPRDRDLLSYFRIIEGGFAPIPDGGRQELHLVYAPDLARALVAGAGAPGGTRAVAEPRVHRWTDVVDAIADAVDRRTVRIPLPPPVVRAAARATELVAGLSGSAAAFNREKAEEMLADAWLHDLDGSEALLPPREATPLRTGMRRTAEWYRSRGWL